MDNQNRRKDKGPIDENFLMSMMAGKNKENLSADKEPDTSESKEKLHIKNKARPKKYQELDYEQLFFKNPTTNARNGKSVYIRPEFHERLTRIVQVIGEDKLSIYAYLDNLLEYHFQEFGEQITESFNDKYKPII